MARTVGSSADKGCSCVFLPAPATPTWPPARASAETAVASGPVETLVLSREAYLRLRADYPAVALDLLEGVLNQVGSAARELVDSLGD